MSICGIFSQNLIRLQYNVRHVVWTTDIPHHASPFAVENFVRKISLQKSIKLTASNYTQLPVFILLFNNSSYFIWYSINRGMYSGGVRRPASQSSNVRTGIPVCTENSFLFSPASSRSSVILFAISILLLLLKIFSWHQITFMLILFQREMGFVSGKLIMSWESCSFLFLYPEYHIDTFSHPRNAESTLLP